MKQIFTGIFKDGNKIYTTNLVPGKIVYGVGGGRRVAIHTKRHGQGGCARGADCWRSYLRG